MVELKLEINLKITYTLRPCSEASNV